MLNTHSHSHPTISAEDSSRAGSALDTPGLQPQDVRKGGPISEAFRGLRVYGFVYILTHMKTTVDIADSLFESARRTATREGTTLRALIEEGLRTVLERRRAKPQQFQLRDGSFAGDGLQHGVDLGDWETIRALIYEDSQS